MKSSNPAFGKKMMDKIALDSTSEAMTINGAINKTMVLGALVLASAVWSWNNPATWTLMVGAIGGFILALITIFSPKSSPITAPLYALLEGLFLGGISLMMEAQYGGIVFQAVTSTIGVLFLMLFLYRSGMVQVNQKFRTGMMAAIGGVFFMYMINFVMSFFGAAFYTWEDTSMMAIGINLVVVGIASFSLLLDFDDITKAANMRAPKYMEWYGAFGLMVTLIWLYLEILKLLSRLSSND